MVAWEGQNVVVTDERVKTDTKLSHDDEREGADVIKEQSLELI